MTRTVSVGLLLLLSGCDTARHMRDDLARLTSPQSAPARKTPPAQQAARSRVPAPVTASLAAASPAAPASPDTPVSPAHPPSAIPAPALAGKSESELRALLGGPTSEEDRPPGKRWRYRDGSCTLDVQLYPDVQTKQFSTLAYEVKSDDYTDEGKRRCLVQLQSRLHPRQ
jgi:hypothetical protein